MIESDDIASVLAPITITDAMMVSITANGVNVAEDSNDEWSGGVTYAVGKRVFVRSTHRVYESVKGDNFNHDPADISNQFNAAGQATWWIDIGPTNRYSMFDSLISTQTLASSPLSITLRPGAFNGLAMFGIDADELEITVWDAPGGNVVYSYSAPLEGSQPSDYYEYFFDPFKPQTQFIETNLVPYGQSEITITLRKGSGNAGIGMIALGDVRPLGAPLRGASVEPVDYSYISTDAFGNTTVRKRSNATSLTITARLNIEDANTVLDTVRSLLGVPVVVVGSKEKMYEHLTVFGLMSAPGRHENYGYVDLNISVRGLI